MIQCVLVTKLDLVRFFLLRFSRGRTCIDGGAHEAQFSLGDQPGATFTALELPLPTDPRWPAKCDRCSYLFAPTDDRAGRSEWLFQLPDKRIVTLSDIPIGGMWYEQRNFASGSIHFRARPDQSLGHLIVRCPCKGTLGQYHDWDIDQKSSNGEGWVRIGTPPDVTATPSIHIVGDYHGWLRAGRLEEC